MYMVRRYYGVGLAGLAVLFVGMAAPVMAGNPSGSMDGIYGNSDYHEQTVNESPKLLDSSDGGGASNSPVPEPGTLILLTTGLAVISGRYLRRT